MSLPILKEQFNITWLKIFSDQTSISLNTLLRYEVMKELLGKIIRSRVCFYVKNTRIIYYLDLLIRTLKCCGEQPVKLWEEKERKPK